MVKGDLIHPELIAALSKCGHGDKVLIADGNYPLATKTGDAEKIYLGLTPGLPDVPAVLRAIQSAIVSAVSPCASSFGTGMVSTVNG